MYSALVSSILLMMNNDEQSIQLSPAQPDHPFSFQVPGGKQSSVQIAINTGDEQEFPTGPTRP